MEELDIMELLYALRKRIKYIIVTVIIFAIAGFVYSKFLITPMYKASTTFVLSKSVDESKQSSSSNSHINSEAAITQNDITLNSKLVSTYREIIKSRTIAEEVINTLNLDMSVSQFKNNISVNSKSDTELVEITVSNKNPELSANIANLLVEVFREKVNEVYNINNLSVIDIAQPNYSPYNIGTVKNTALFTIVGLFLSCAVIFVIVYFDDTVKEEKDVESLLNIPVIVTIPKFEETDKGGKSEWKKEK